MNERFEFSGSIEPSSRDREQALEIVAELPPDAREIALVVEDNMHKARALMDPGIGLLPEEVARVRARSAVEACALFEALVTRETPEDDDTPSIVVFMDGRFPTVPGAMSRAVNGMGLGVVVKIVDYCLENDKNIPYFVGFSSDSEPNEDIRMLLAKEGFEEKYIGDMFVDSETEILKRLGASGLAGFDTED